MAVARKAPKCPKCGESYKGIFADRGRTFVGDSFIRWDTEGHVCRLGVKYFIERMDTRTWYMKQGWTADPMQAKLFNTREQADHYLTMSLDIPARLNCEITEHEFVSHEQLL